MAIKPRVRGDFATSTGVGHQYLPPPPPTMNYPALPEVIYNFVKKLPKITHFIRLIAGGLGELY
jgi:hypothetical protein